jgi:hypothetical protein
VDETRKSGENATTTRVESTLAVPGTGSTIGNASPNGPSYSRKLNVGMHFI